MTGMAAKNVRIDPQRALIPISLGVFFVLRFVLGVPTQWLLLLTLWIPAYYLGFPKFKEHKWQSFEREFAYRFPKEDYEGLLKFYKGQWFLRQFGPRPQMMEKLALIYQGMERFQEAERILDSAIQMVDRRERATFLTNLAHIKFELGKYEDAESIYKRLLKRSPHLESARLRLALIRADRGENRHGESLEVLEDNLKRVTGKEKERVIAAIEKLKK